MRFWRRWANSSSTACAPASTRSKAKGLTRRDELYPLIASLIRAERTHRQARSISYRIAGAKFPVLKDIDKFVFADTPVDEGQVRELIPGLIDQYLCAQSRIPMEMMRHG